MPPGPAHAFVIEIPNSPEIQPWGIDIEQNRARPSRPPAAEVQIPPKQAQRRGVAATLAKNHTVLSRQRLDANFSNYRDNSGVA
jgi:hypothetical protein